MAKYTISLKYVVPMVTLMILVLGNEANAPRGGEVTEPVRYGMDIECAVVNFATYLPNKTLIKTKPTENRRKIIQQIFISDPFRYGHEP